MSREIINGVVVIHPELPTSVLATIVAEEHQAMSQRKDKNGKTMKLGSVTIEVINADTLEVLSKPKATIRRLRRITGYLSDADNFNHSKASELADRYTHVDIQEEGDYYR